MLLGAGWVVDGDISDLSLSPQQVGTLSVNVHDGKGFVILERVEPPSALGNASLGWLVVLDDHSPECVGIFCQSPRQFKVGFLLLGRRLICISKRLLLVLFALLAVFPAPLVVLLPLSLLGGERLPFPVSVSSTTLSLPGSV